MKKNAWILALSLSFGFALFGQNANAARMYKLDGKIVGMTAQTITVQQGGELYELSREGAGENGIPKDAKVGDQVSVFYTMDVHKLSRKSSQKAGEAPKTLPKPQPDDRLFYDARNASPDAARG